MAELLSNSVGNSESPTVGSDHCLLLNPECPTTPALKRHERRTDKTSVRFVIFNTGDATERTVWEWLQGCLPDDLLGAIISIKKVTHVSGHPRMDLWTRPELGEVLKRNITAARKEDNTPNLRGVLKRCLNYWNRRSQFPWSWRVDVYRPWRDRARTPTKAKGPTRDDYTAIMTWNVNGFHSKEEVVKQALFTQKVAICVLQETLVGDASKPIRVDGYSVFCEPRRKGFRGMAVLVDNRLPAYRIPHEEPWLIHVKVSHWRHAKEARVGIHILGVYFPSGGNYRGGRTMKLKALSKLSRELTERNPQDLIVALGDFNKPFDEVVRRLYKDGAAIQGLETVGSRLSRFPERGRPSDLDHMLGNNAMHRWFRKPRVMRSYAVSDHRPVILTSRERVPDEVGSNSRVVFNKQMVNRHKQTLVNCNRWEPLLNLVEGNEEEHSETREQGLNAITGAFNKVFDEECRQLNIKRDLKDNAPKNRIPRKVATLLKKVKLTSERLEAVRGKPTEDRIRVLLARSKKRYKKAHSKWRAQERMKCYDRIAHDMATFDFKSAWTRVKVEANLLNSTGENMPMKPSQPLRDKRGVLRTKPEELQSVMADHYKELLQDDETGNMRSYEYWRDKHGWDNEEESQTEDGCNTDPASDETDLNKPFTWREYLMSIREMNGGTSPGLDEVHIDVFKGLLAEECMAEIQFQNEHFVRRDNIQVHLPELKLPDMPRTAMGKAVKAILDETWKLKRLPEAWEENVVVSLFKKGNPELPDNYRGVTLISVLEKILTGAMLRRLTSYLESKGILTRAQAGFRKGEEAIAQYITLAEAIRRRYLDGETTVGVFVDFKKAYDKVPHGLLWLTMERTGIKGRMLDMVMSIYQQTRVSIRAGGGRSEAFALWRGLRQGCLLSPLLFLLFINGLLEAIQSTMEDMADADPTIDRRVILQYGAAIPGQKNDKRGQHLRAVHELFKGLLYADDVVVLLNSARAAPLFAKALYEITTDAGMELGYSKCGAIIWSKDESVVKDFYEKHETDLKTPSGDIPKVHEYKYLGIVVDKGLVDSRVSVNDEMPTEMRYTKVLRDKGLRAIHALKPVLTARFCPLPVKIAVIRTFVIPRLLYGGEWLAFKKVHTDLLQKVVDTAIQWSLGRKFLPASYTEVINWEMGIPTIETEMAAARTRLLAKATRTNSPMKTWLPLLVEYPMRNRCRTWVTSGHKEIVTLLGMAEGATLASWEATRCGDEVGDIDEDNMDTSIWNAVEQVKDRQYPIREWMARTKVYEIHIRSNNFVSESLQAARRLLAGIVDPDEVEEMVEDPIVVGRRMVGGALNARLERIQTMDFKRSKRQRLWEYAAVQVVRDSIAERAWRRVTPPVLMYDQFSYGTTRGFIRASIWRPDLKEGIRLLTMGRMGCFPTRSDHWYQLRKAGVIDPGFTRTECALCLSEVEPGWEFAHLLMGCTNAAVTAVRTRRLGACIKLIMSELDGRHSLAEAIGNPAGLNGQNGIAGVVAIYLAGGVVGQYYDCSFHYGFGHLSLVPRGLDTFGCLYVCSYLVEVFGLYASGIGVPGYNPPDNAANMLGAGSGD